VQLHLFASSQDIGELRREEAINSKWLYSNIIAEYINFQLDPLIIIYSQNTIFVFMFQASSAHHQQDTVVYMQRMVLKMST